MGKRQHQKDKLYLTCTEWSHLYGGRRPDADLNERLNNKFHRLPFDHCSLSLQPFKDPICNVEGYVFDISNIVPFVKKYGVDPISGNKIEAKSLFKLNFSKNSEGFYQCPVLFKVFTENSHIVAIRTTGNVFSYEAVEQLNFKAKNFRDLLTDESFTKKDVIVIQEPMDTERKNAANFHHIKNKLKWADDEEENPDNMSSRLKTMDSITRTTLQELSKSSVNNVKQKTSTSEDSKPDKPDKFNTATYSSGKAAASLTSTAMDPETKVEAATLSDDAVRYSRVKGKAYVQFQTTLGPLNFELFCSETPKTCHNFIQLCKQEYYNGTIFHRSIKHFMVQGGDPTGTGHGGESVWKVPFEDEFKSHLNHQGRGVLSMANSGKNTNKSQFFITYRSCRHLDRKHTVFGKLVGGFETLDKIEKIETDDQDRPKNEIKVLKSVVFVDPFQEVDDYLLQERLKMQQSNDQLKCVSAKNKSSLPPKRFRDGVGAFVNLNSIHSADTEDTASQSSQNKKTKGRSTFGDFSSW